jgi:hypothetical protein
MHRFALAVFVMSGLDQYLSRIRTIRPGSASGSWTRIRSHPDNLCFSGTDLEADVLQDGFVVEIFVYLPKFVMDSSGEGR